jgi:PAS domain S-box-containing protein
LEPVSVSLAIALLPYVLSVMLSLSLSAYGYRHRQIPAARPFIVFTLGQALWTQGYIGELVAETLPGKVAWDSYQFIGMFVATTATLYIAIRYTGKPVRHPRRLLQWLLVIPVLVTAAALTEPLHHLMRGSAHIVPGKLVGALWYDFTLIDSLGFLYAYGVLLWATGILISHHHRGNYLVRRQTAVLVTGFLIPVVLVTFFLFYHPWPQRDASPFVFLLSGLVQGLGLFRVRLFDLLPVAREVLFEEIAAGVLVVDVESRIVDLNPAAQALLGMSQAAAVGRNISEVATRAALTLPDPSCQAQVSQTRGADGDVRWIEATSQFLDDAHEVHRGTIVILRDVTDARQRAIELENSHNELERKVRERTLALSEEVAQRRQAEAALIESEQRFRAIFTQSFQLVGLLDPNGTLLDCNDAALAIVDCQLNDVVGRPIWETPWWSHSSEQAERLRLAVGTAASGEFVRFEVTHRTAAGGLRDVDFSLKPVKDDQGRVILIIPEGRDVTDLKRSERERQGLAVKLLQAERLEALGRLAGGVAHDFNNLLTVIVGDLSLLHESATLEGDHAEAVQGALDATRRAAALTRQLLAFSRRQVIEPKVFEPAECLQNLKPILDRVLGEAVMFTLDVIGEPGPVFMDPSQFEQVVMNLVVNARDAMPNGGHLTVELAPATDGEASKLARTDESFVRLTVTDSGIGIDEQDLPHVFEPFFTTKGPSKGTGLGLATVHGVVTQAAGTVTIESEKNRGTSFRVYLPCCSTACDSAVTGNPLTPNARPVGRVLLVEDQASVRELVARTLTRFGFVPLAHSDARSALEYAIANCDAFDVVLTDVVMPNMGGRELADALRQVRPSVPIVFMSGHADDTVLRGNVERSREHFIAKPFTPAALVEKLHRVLS